MSKLMELAISIGKYAPKKQALYMYLSRCGLLSASEVEKEYPDYVKNATCVSDFYADEIIKMNDVSGIKQLYLDGASIYQNMVRTHLEKEIYESRKNACEKKRFADITDRMMAAL